MDPLQRAVNKGVEAIKIFKQKTVDLSKAFSEKYSEFKFPSISQTKSSILTSLKNFEIKKRIEGIKSAKDPKVDKILSDLENMEPKIANRLVIELTKKLTNVIPDGNSDLKLEQIQTNLFEDQRVNLFDQQSVKNEIGQIREFIKGYDAMVEKHRKFEIGRKISEIVSSRIAEIESVKDPSIDKILSDLEKIDPKIANRLVIELTEKLTNVIPDGNSDLKLEQIQTNLFENQRVNLFDQQSVKNEIGQIREFIKGYDAMVEKHHAYTNPQIKSSPFNPHDLAKAVKSRQYEMYKKHMDEKKLL